MNQNATQNVGTRASGIRPLTGATGRAGRVHRLAPYIGLAVVLAPFLASLIRAFAQGWTLEGDEAIVATRAHDVFGPHSPLVGAWSTTSNLVGRDTFSPGPLLYWLLAIPARLPGDAALVLVMGAVNALSAVGAVLIARRRGGPVLMLVTAAGIVLMTASLPTEVLRSIWSPAAPVFPFTLLIFVAWTVACGDYRLLPLAVGLASFVTHCHLAYLVPSAALLSVALVGLWWTSRRGDPSSRPRDRRRWITAAAVVALICWSAPVVDQVIHTAGERHVYGNLSTLVEAIGDRNEPVGLKGGAYAVVRAVGVPAWWLQQDQSPVVRVFEIFARPGVGSIVTATALVLALVALAAAGVRRKRLDVVAATLVALALVASLMLVTASFPNVGSSVFPYSYASWLASPLGLWTWIAAGWSIATLWPPRLGLAAASGVGVPVLVAAVVAIALVVVATQDRDTQHRLYDPVDGVTDAVQRAIPAGATVYVAGSSLPVEGAIVHTLRQRGDVVGSNIGNQLGLFYVDRSRRYDYAISVTPGTSVPDGARRIADFRPDANVDHWYTVTLGRSPPSG